MSESRQQEENEVENPTMRRLRRLTVPITQESCPLSISTRAIGLLLPKVTERLIYLSSCNDYSSDDDYSNEYYRDTYWKKKNEVPLSAMYRVSLAQLEAKVHLATSNQRLFMNPSVHHLYDLQPSALLYNLIDHMKFGYYNDMPSPVSVIINSIGHVETNGMHYEPKFTKKITPLNLRISTLRKYCEDMANPNTPAEDRKTGYLLNSIPNAQWENENDLDSVVLKNPDDIIAADYNRNSFSEDLEKMNEYLWPLQWRDKLTFQKTIAYEGFGDPGILVSTHVVPGKSWRLNEKNKDPPEWYPNFWSRESLAPESWSIGVLTLAGELLDPIDEPYRSQTLAAEVRGGRWREICNVFLYDYGSRNRS